MSFYSAIITLVLVMDPLGNVPMFMSALKHLNPKKRSWIILRESLMALVILTFFLFFGQFILKGMDISQHALSISGGIILFIISLRMIFHEDEPKSHEKKEPFLVPLAIPLIAGPSTMTVVMLLGNQVPTQRLHWFLTLLIAWAISSVILLSSNLLSRLLGERGLIAMERLMGMILTTMAVQMFINGFQQVMNA